MSNIDITYPTTRAEDCTETIMGLEFPDPYRWLESETEEVRQWQGAQNRLADDYVQSWPHYEALKESVSQYLIGRPALPIYAGEQWFRLGSIGDKTGVIVANEPYGPGRLIFDVDSENLPTPPALPWISPSPDGRLLAVGVCTDGSENNTIRLINVETGERLPNPPSQTLMDGWTGGARWLPDNSGFYFQALVGNPINFQQQVLFHSVTDGKETVVELPLQDPKGHEYILIMVSPEGRFHLAYQGLSEVHLIAVRDTHEPQPTWQAFIAEAEGSIAGHVIENSLIAVTNIEAPRGRVISIPLDANQPSDTQCWTELVAESEAVIRSITPVNNLLYVSEFVDTYSRVRIFDQNGAFVSEMPLPGRGSVDELLFPIMKLASARQSDKFVFSYSTLSTSWGVYSHHPSQKQLEVLQSPQITIDNAIVEDYWAISEDGTRIPYQSLRLATTDNTKPQPTLIYAYGGFNLARPPEYPGAMAAFVAAGGVYILGHLRGGSEFGKGWWQGGRMQNKQNSYQDLYAIAEDLIDHHRTTSDLLAVNGRSNGGLMSGVALTQRPDLWKAVVPQVPLLDLLGALRCPYDRYCIGIELADPENLDEIKTMAAYSPYQSAKDNAHYPAVFLDAGATDPRCPPWHARKFAARLQATNDSDKPVLLRVWENSGHGQATARESLVSQYTNWLAFVMQQLGLEISVPMFSITKRNA